MKQTKLTQDESKKAVYAHFEKAIDELNKAINVLVVEQNELHLKAMEAIEDDNRPVYDDTKFAINIQIDEINAIYALITRINRTMAKYQ